MDAIQETRCHLCRQDHDPLRCPLAEICYACFNRGHQRTNCPDRSVRKYCVHCDSQGHSTMECGRVWRQYRLSRSSRTSSSGRHAMDVYCYLCAGKDHFGDNCTHSRTEFQVTAFSKSPSADGTLLHRPLTIDRPAQHPRDPDRGPAA
ncbi:hypothetical protein BC831DRAFT_456649, partial [Entophlyctis helioformis]